MLRLPKSITWDSGKGRAVSGPFPLLFSMSDFLFFILNSNPEMQKKVEFFFWKSDVEVSHPHQIPAYSCIPVFPRREPAALLKAKSHLMTKIVHNFLIPSPNRMNQSFTCRQNIIF